jgi:hypothetical protein
MEFGVISLEKNHSYPIPAPPSEEEDEGKGGKRDYYQNKVGNWVFYFDTVSPNLKLRTKMVFLKQVENEGWLKNFGDGRNPGGLHRIRIGNRPRS